MDMHPSGFPRLVGPEGSPFPQSDVSSSFRYLPNNVTNELPPSNLDSLPITRSHPQPLHLRAYPSSPRPAPAPHSLRLCSEHSKPSSPHESPSPPPHHLLPSETSPFFVLPNPTPHQPPPHAISPPNIVIAACAAVEIQQEDGAMLIDDQGITHTSDEHP